jgi:hypothetical protein
MSRATTIEAVRFGEQARGRTLVQARKQCLR